MKEAKEDFKSAFDPSKLPKRVYKNLKNSNFYKKKRIFLA